MLHNIFWVRVPKQDILPCLEKAGFEVLFKYRETADLYDIDDSDIEINLAGCVLYDTVMIIWLTPSQSFKSSNEKSVNDLGNNISKKFCVPAYFGDINFGDNINELDPPTFIPHKSFHCIKLDRPRIIVDFNEICGDDLYFLSQKDIIIDSEGQKVLLEEGLQVSLFDDDFDDNGNYDPLLADAVVEKNTLKEKYPMVKWLARLLPNDIAKMFNGTIYYLSDIKKIKGSI